MNMRIHQGGSRDALHFENDPEPIESIKETPEL
jgi:hypothetical protein